MTKSPMLIVPATIPRAQSSMTALSPPATITTWPTLSSDSESWSFTAAPSYPCSASSRRRASCASLPKYLTVSKLSRLSMDLVLARPSASFILRRKRIRHSVTVRV